MQQLFVLNSINLKSVLTEDSANSDTQWISEILHLIQKEKNTPVLASDSSVSQSKLKYPL